MLLVEEQEGLGLGNLLGWASFILGCYLLLCFLLWLPCGVFDVISGFVGVHHDLHGAHRGHLGSP